MNEAEHIANAIIEMLKIRGKEDMLDDVIEVLKKEQHIQAHEVVVESATILEESDLDHLEQLITAQLGFEPVMVQKVDPGLIGGVKLKIGDMVVDVTLKGRLSQLRKNSN